LTSPMNQPTLHSKQEVGMLTRLKAVICSHAAKSRSLITRRHRLVSALVLAIAACSLGFTETSWQPVAAQQAAPWRPYQFGPATSIIADSQGTIWIATNSGVIRFSGGFKTFSDGLPSNRVNVVYADRAGNLLAGTSRGAAKLDGERFTAFPPSGELAGKDVRAIGQDQAGTYWFATSAGLLTYDGQKLAAVNGAPAALSSTRVIYRDRAGALWFGTDAGLVRRSGGSFQNVGGGRVYVIHQTEAGLLVGTSQGAARLAGGNLSPFPPGGELARDVVRAIYQDRSGLYWFGTTRGVFTYDGKQVSAMKIENISFASNKVVAIAGDESGNLWFGTDDIYVARYTPEAAGTIASDKTAERITTLVQQAQADLKANRWAQAVAKFQEVLKLDAQNADAKRGLRDARVGQLVAQAELQRGDKKYDDAIKSLDDALQLDPDNQMIEARLREFMIERQAWALNTQIEKAYSDGMDHLKARRWAQAITKFDEVLKLNPQNERARRGKRDAYLGHAEEQQRAGQLTEAVGSLESARQLSPNDPAITRTLQDIRSQLSQEQRRAEAQRAYNQGQAALSARRWNDAIARFNEASGLDPEFQPARQGLKEAYLGQGRTQVAAEQWDQAVRSLEEAQRLDPNDQEAARLLQDAKIGKLYAEGVTRLASKQWSEAITNFSEVLGLNRQYRDASDRLIEAQVHKFYDDGLTAFKNQEFDKAIANFDRIIQAKATVKSAGIKQSLGSLFKDADSNKQLARVESLFKIGMERLNNGDYPEASLKFDEVLKINPNHEQARRQREISSSETNYRAIEDTITRGQENLKQGKWEEAAALFEVVLRQYPNHVRAKEGKEKALQEIAAAQTRQRMLWTIGGTGGVGLLLIIIVLWSPLRRARIYSSLGRLQQAGQLYENVGLHDQALSLYESSLRLKPDDVGVLMLVGKVYLKKGNHDRALQAFHHILELGQGQKEVYKKLLEIHDGMQASDRLGLDLYGQAWRAEPESPELNRLLSRLYLSAGRTDEHAIEVYRRAIIHEPDNLRLRLMSGQGYLEEGRFRETIEEAKQILARNADDGPALSLFLKASHRNGSLDDALATLDSHRFCPLTTLAAYESLVELEPAYRPAVHERYCRIATGLTEEHAERPLYLAHLALDDGETNQAADHLSQAHQHEPKSDAYLGELIRAYRRLVLLKPGPDPELIFRLGELNRQQGDWRQALSSFQQIVRIPEWKLRAGKALEEILDGLPLAEAAAKFFEDVNWHVVGFFPGQETRDFIVNPTQPFEKKIYSFFERAQVRCFERPVTVEDIVQLKHDLGGQNQINREVTFVIVPIRPRQDVYALIYALITEEPPLTVIPLEAAALKQAIIDLKCADVLEQTLHQWLGQGDLYDIHSPIADAATFFGRGQFINRLTTKIIQRENFGIFGLRKVGKTSLIFQLRENLPTNLIAYVDLQSISSGRGDEIYFRLIEALRREVRVKYPDAPLPEFTLTSYDPREEYPTVATDFHNDLLRLKQVLERDGKMPHVLLLLDEIELMIPYGQSQGFQGYDGFFRQVRGLYQQEGFVLSGVVGADPTLCRAGKWGDRDNPVFQYYDEVFLTPLERHECEQMIQGIGEMMGISYSPASLELIYDESGGHPYVARQLCSRVVNRYKDRPLEVGERMVHEGIDDYIAQRFDYFVGVFRGYLSNEARKILEAAAITEENQMTRPELIAFAERAGFDREALEKALQDLELFHLLVRERESYRIKIKLMRRWIRRSWLGVE
jgi:tetratricopeptide (TPR) repeat protein